MWSRFVESLRSCSSTWAFCVALLSGVRVLFVALFWQRAAPDALGELGTALVHGVRFDLRIVTLWLIPVTILGIVHALVDVHRPLRWLLDVSGTLFVATTPLLAAIASGYYAEFDRPLGPRLFGLIYDDTGAILATLVSDYGLVPKLLGVAIASGIAVFALRRWEKLRLGKSLVTGVLDLGFWPRVTLVLLVAIGALGATRGSFGGRPAMRKWSGITSDRLLNDAVLNPYSALVYAIKDHLRLGRVASLETYLPDRDVGAAIARLTGGAANPDTIDAAFARQAAGAKIARPSQVFLVVLESYDIWPLLPEYAAWGAGDDLRRLAGAGLLFDRFVPSAESTMAALSAILLGLPDAGVFTARQATAQQRYPSALGAIFARLGYRTRAFYGGMMSWQRLGDFCRTQGFAGTYDRSVIDPTFESGWGIDDGPLYEFVGKTLAGDPAPSLNLIVTLSYHPPYDIDLAASGWPDTPPPGFVPSARLSWRHVGHLAYADRQLGAFVDRMHARFPDALFVITGDHTSRRYPHDRPSAYESAAVPLVLYGSAGLAELKSPTGAAGSDIDILPTLVDLVAPRGFAYTAFGHDLLAAAGPSQVGFGRRFIIGGDFLVDLRDAAVGAPIVHCDTGVASPDLAPLLRRYNDLNGVAWWRIVRGSALGRDH